MTTSGGCPVLFQVLTTLPMVAALFPLDAIASILDGSLLAAKHTDYMSVVQVRGHASHACIGVMSNIEHHIVMEEEMCQGTA
jgi:hypothetical protein